MMKNKNFYGKLNLMEKKAVALIVCLLLVTVLIIIGSAIYVRSVSEKTSAQKYSESAQAFWLAEAGIESAIVQLKQNWFNRNPSGEIPLGAGTYSFNIYDTDRDGNKLPKKVLRIVSTGNVKGTLRSVDVTIERYGESWDYAIYGVTMVELSSGSTIHGDVYVDGDGEVQAGASIVKIDDTVEPADPNAYDAIFYYTGSEVDVSGIVEGGTQHTTEEIPPPTIDWDKYESNADYVISGGTVLSGLLADGVYYINGDVQLNNVTLNKGSIISEGKIEVNGLFDQGAPGDNAPALANKTGTIEVNGSAKVRGLVYCSDSGIELTTDATMTVYGSVTAAGSGVELKTDLGDLQVYFKEGYLTPFPLTRDLKNISWREIPTPYPLSS